MTIKFLFLEDEIDLNFTALSQLKACISENSSN